MSDEMNGAPDPAAILNQFKDHKEPDDGLHS